MLVDAAGDVVRIGKKMALHAFAGPFECPEAAQQDDDGDDAAQLRRYFGTHGDGVVQAVGQHGIQPHLEAGQGCAILVEVVEGIVNIRFASAPNIMPDQPVKILGKICSEDKKIYLEGKAIYQSIKDGLK